MDLLSGKNVIERKFFIVNFPSLLETNLKIASRLFLQNVIFYIVLKKIRCATLVIEEKYEFIGFHILLITDNQKLYPIFRMDQQT